MHPATHSVTQWLVDWGRGDQTARDRLIPVLYDELRRLADYYLRRERSGHTLQATALVHEAYLQLVDQKGLGWQSRAHFFGIAARLMRQILVQHARGHQAVKRGGGVTWVSLDEAVDFFRERDVSLVALDEALDRLAAVDPRQSRLVELRFFGGLEVPEAAEVLGISLRTAHREWRLVKAWLRNQLRAADAGWRDEKPAPDSP